MLDKDNRYTGTKSFKKQNINDENNQQNDENNTKEKISYNDGTIFFKKVCLMGM
jgi:hypothetical protein